MWAIIIQYYAFLLFNDATDSTLNEFKSKRHYYLSCLLLFVMAVGKISITSCNGVDFLYQL